ncbi:hypothetical protein HDU86_006958 [Geranomyces michiganensis]|nr:hypothetical protein HDU86_006958 [Geranomyces michiganensis]
MAPTLKLDYFNIKGRGEPIRLALTVAGLDFEDHRFGHDEWPKYKPTTPFGQVPVLHVDGKPVSQTVPIMRYIGKIAPQSGLYPSDAWTALKVDELIGGIEDISLLLRPSFYESDPEKKVNARKELSAPDGALTKALERLEAFVAKTSGKFAVGDNLTIADIMLYGNMWQLKSGLLDGMPTNVYDNHPTLNKIFDAVKSHPKIAEWESKH